MSNSRRKFIKNASLGTAALGMASLNISAKSYSRILGSNNLVRVGIVGFSDRARNTLIPAFLQHSEELNFEFTGVSDIWKRRRNEGADYLKELTGYKVKAFENNEALYDSKNVDAVMISTADFQHALHTIEAVDAGCDAYVEKPLAETMEDNREVKKIVERSGRIIQIGSQRRSGSNYHAAYDFIQSGKFGPITMVEMSWNVNQPGRWRRPELVADLRESDVDWKRYILNRPYESFDPRKYIEYRLFWPYSSGIPGQWMSHQIDTVHWFSGFSYPRSVSANGGIYAWHDGRTNFDTMTAVFDYGPSDDLNTGFQVVYSSRMHNSAGGVKEIYYSNGGELNLDTNQVTPTGGLTEKYASSMGMEPNLLQEFSLVAENVQASTDANTGADTMTSKHMRNWMECVRDRNKETNAPIRAGYYHSVANIMVTAALRTGKKVTFNEEAGVVLAGENTFKY